MEKKPKIHTYFAAIRALQEKIVHALSIAWPPKLSHLKNPKFILAALLKSSRLTQSLAAASFIGLLISIVVATFGLYSLFTVEEPAAGGIVREVVVNNSLELFNPVLSNVSGGEEKISSLLYHPLYYVTYPNFENNNLEEPAITPVLLANAPEWKNTEGANLEEQFKTLHFELKENIFWSDDSPITTADIKYSFDRLKEVSGKTQFRDSFQNVSLRIINEQEFELQSELPNPQLLYISNFSPISKDYFSSQSTDRLYTDPKSSSPEITSGYYTFASEEVDDPDTPEDSLVKNPVTNSNTGFVEKVFLTRNTVTNYEQPQIEQYIFYNVNSILGESSNSTLQSLTANLQIDIYNRFAGSNLSLNPDELKDIINLNQTIRPTNTFYTLYLNIRSGDIFVNQTLRAYVLCSLFNFTQANTYNESLQLLPKNKALVPLQLGISKDPECLENPADMLDNSVYSFSDTVENQSNRLLIFGLPTSITMIGSNDSNPLLSDLVNFFTNEIGISVELIDDPEEVQNRLSEKDYNVAMLPITYTSRDLTPVYGSTGRDISEIRRNRRVEPDVFEQNLKTYSLSNYQDQDARSALADFFISEYVSFNLFRLNTEYNYGDRVINFESTLPEFEINNYELYISLPKWFVNTERAIR